MALGRQFRLMRASYDPTTNGMDKFTSVSQRNYRVVDDRDQTHANMTVLDYSNTPRSRQGWNERMYGRTPNEFSDGEGRPGQQVLFKEEYEGSPGTSKLHNASMTKGARSFALPLLAQAAHDTAEMGRHLKPSENLSAQSAPLVKRLKAAGLVDENAVTSQSNNVGFMDNTWDYNEDATEVNEQLDLRAASRKGRSILKATRPPKPDQSKQLRLFRG